MAYVDVDKFAEKICDFQAIDEDCATKMIWLLRTFPTSDVKEVKHGEWIPVQYTYFGLKRYECSECKDDEYWQKRYLEHKEKYCPNCGAKMNVSKTEATTERREAK